MPDWASQVTGTAPAEKPQDWTKELNQALADREAQATPAGANKGGPFPGQQRVTRPGPDGLPVYVDLPEPRRSQETNFGAAFKENFVQDPETKRRVVAESLFPGDPSGISRVGFADGEPVYIDDSGELRYVSSRSGRFAGATLANTPEAAGAIVGSFAEGNPITGSATGAAGGRAIKRGLSQLIFDEPATAASVGKEMATEALIDATGGVVAKGITKGIDRGKTVDFTPRDMQAAEETRRQVKDTTGVDIDLAQASGDRKLIGMRQYAARFPGKSADDVQQFDERALGQFEAATTRALDSIAAAKPSEVYGSQGVNAAARAIANARREVSEEVKPLYDAAYAATPEVTDKHVTDMLNLPYFKAALRSARRLAILEGSSGAKQAATNNKNPRDALIQAASQTDLDAAAQHLKLFDEPFEGSAALESLYLQKSKELKRGVAKSASPPAQQELTQDSYSLRDLDYVKRALDDRIEVLGRAGKRQEARALTIRRNEFVSTLDDLDNNQWQAARKKYQELAQSKIEPLENGVVGIIAKVKDPKAATAAAKIFQDANVTPSQIRYARNVIERQDPEAWNGLVRQWLGQKWNAAMKETQTGDVVNPAGKFRQAVFGTPQDRAKAAAMLPGGSAPVFHDLMTAAEKLASTPIAGSNTMRDTEIKDQLKGTGAVVFRWLTSPRQQFVNAAEQRALNQGTEAITQALLDPTKRAQLKRIVRMAPSTRQAILISTIIGGKATAVAAEDVDDRTPPLLERTQR